MQINKELAAAWKPEQDHKLLPFAKLDHKRRFHAAAESPYILPADVSEQERLVLQHKLITFGFGRLFHMPIDDELNEGKLKILDVGCGPGAWSRQMAKAYPNAVVIGLDMAKTVLIDADSHDVENLTFVEGNVLERLPFEDNTFDVVYQRLLILGIPKDKWVPVIKELKRVTKPGGYIELVESDGKFFKPGPKLSKLWDPFCDGMEARGIDLEAGIKIKTYMEEAGVQVVDEALHSAPVGWGGRFGEIGAINIKNVFGALKPFLIKILGLSDRTYDSIAKHALEECTEYKSYINFYAYVGKVYK